MTKTGSKMGPSLLDQDSDRFVFSFSDFMLGSILASKSIVLRKKP